MNNAAVQAALHVVESVEHPKVAADSSPYWSAFGLKSWKDVSFRTIKGYIYYPLAPNCEAMFTHIDIEDIALGLANKARFNGQLDRFYSVAQHSVHVSDLVRSAIADVRLAALLHDAAEFVLGDLNTILKPLFPYFATLEHRTQCAIHRRFGLPDEISAIMHGEIKLADRRAVLTEKRDLRRSIRDEVWHGYEDIQPDRNRILPLSQEIAAEQFLDRFAQYNTER